MTRAIAEVESARGHSPKTEGRGVARGNEVLGGGRGLASLHELCHSLSFRPLLLHRPLARASHDEFGRQPLRLRPLRG